MRILGSLVLAATLAAVFPAPQARAQPCPNGVCPCPAGLVNVDGVCRCPSGTTFVDGACRAS